LRGEVQIVHYEQRRELRLADARSDEIEHRDLVVNVEERRRLVEQEDRRALRQRTRDRNALLLAARQRRKRPRAQLPRLARAQRLGGDGCVVRRLEAEEAEVRRAAHQHDLPRGVRERDLIALRHQRERARELGARSVARVVAGNANLTGIGHDEPSRQARERRLPRAIRPDHADELPRRDDQRDPVDRARGARRVAERYVVEHQRGLLGAASH